MIVFIDESGLSERPCRARTWARRGETPVLQYRFSWLQLSVITGISYRRSLQRRPTLVRAFRRKAELF